MSVGCVVYIVLMVFEFAFFVLPLLALCNTATNVRFLVALDFGRKHTYALL